MVSFVAGVFSGLVLGTIDVCLFLAIAAEDAETSLLAAFLNRFGIGIVIPALRDVTWPGWLIGLIFGALLSLPYAIVTGWYGFVLLVGAVGGFLIGGVTRGWRAHSG